MSFNKAIIQGNIGKDPAIKSFNGGGKVANFTLATSEKWTDKNTGERQERTQWHNVVIRQERIVDIVERYAKKGSNVLIEGQIEYRKYTDQSGAERFITEIVVGFNGSLTLLADPRESSGSAAGGGRTNGQQQRGDYGQGAGNRRPTQDGYGHGSDADDDIPF